MPGTDTTQIGLRARQYSVLIVDDDTGIRKLLRKLLERQKFVVAEACDGMDALERVKEQEFNAVITDVMMPRLSGIQLLAKLRKAYPLVPVIIITGKPAIEAAVECMKNGAYDYISKPFDFGQIKKVIQNALSEHQRLKDSRESSDSSTTIFNLTNRRFFGEYKILQVLGEGNIGIVFLAEKKGGGRHKRCALKVLKPTLITQIQSDKSLERFLKEAEAIAAVKHKNVVEMFDYGLTDQENVPYMVMEYVRGRSLDYYIVNHAKLDMRQKLDIVAGIADALEAIHSKGICHRDIKPHNIILSHDMQVKVTDFGIAKVPGSDLTMTYELIGSPAYLSPEGFTSSRVDHRADIFSLGVLAYELMLGRKPFIADSISRYAHLIQYELPEEPRKLDPDFPKAIQAVLAKLLKKSPDDRYQHAGEIRDALTAISDHEDVHVAGVSGDKDSATDWR